jgi:ParB family chromosome partitioning protein
MNKQEMTVAEVEVKKTKNNDYFLVDPRNIEINEDDNIRTDYGDIEDLSTSIVELGQIEPLQAVKKRGEDKYVLVDGFRRMRAINLAIQNGHSIPYVKVMATSGNAEDQLFMMLVTGIGKKPLTPIEEAEGYKRLVAYGYEAKEIAKKVGKSMGHVYNMLKLSDAPKAVKVAIAKGDISATTVSQAIRETKSPEELTKVVNEAVAIAKSSGKKATAKAVTKVKSPMQKLRDAYAVAVETMPNDADRILDLIDLLDSKDSTPESIAKFFETK